MATYHNLLDVLPNNSAWAADWNQNVAIIKNALRTFKLTETVTGSTSVAYKATVQLQDAVGNNVAEQFCLRVRVCDFALITNATNALLSADTGTTLLETITTNKDLYVKSDANGLVSLVISNSVAESFSLLIGHARSNVPFANYNNRLDMSNAALLNGSGNPIFNSSGAALYHG